MAAIQLLSLFFHARKRFDGFERFHGPRCQLHVFLGTLLHPLSFMDGEDSEHPRGCACGQMAGRDFETRFDQRTGSHEGVIPNDSAIHYDCIHSHKCPHPHTAAMHNGPVSDMPLLINYRFNIWEGVDHAGVLNAGTFGD